MSSESVDVLSVDSAVEYRTTERRCFICLTTQSLDDDRPALGTVRWKIATHESGLRIGTAVGFLCLNGHSSQDDPALLKAFPSRRF